MKALLSSENEEQRLKALALYDILDTLPEKEYDTITSIAAKICDCNISLVSLVDRKRQWFKSSHGMEVQETPIEYSFCALAIRNTKDIFVIKDARLDARFSDNPLVTGQPFIKFYAGVPLFSSDGFPLGTLCIIDDKPKQLSPNQISTLKALANQVVQLLELRKAKNRIEKSNIELVKKNKELEQFTYIASHDLQEPIRTIQNFALHLDSNFKANLDPVGQKSLSFILEASDRMGVLVNELLTYSLLGRQSSVKEVDANMVVQSILDDFQLVIQESKAKVIHVPLPKLYVYETEFRLLIQNLVSNAIKFSKSDRHPEITISAVETKDKWTFKIEDNGIGIDEKHQDKIFEIFQRLHIKEKFDGTGIGLSHCKKIVELHKGDIWVDSAIDKGSSFYFTIPTLLP